MTEAYEFELVVAIAKEGDGNLLAEAAQRKGGATGATILHSRGIGMKSSEKFFGISLSDEQEMVLIACRSHQKKSIMKAILESPASRAATILFSVPISSAAGLWSPDQPDDDAEGD
jgi:hypothetical protein